METLEGIIVILDVVGLHGLYFTSVVYFKVVPNNRSYRSFPFVMLLL